MKLASTIFIVPLLCLTSCASIMNGKYQDVSIQSEPCGATVWIDNNQKGTTPLIASLERSKQHEIRMELAGYQPYQAVINPKTSGWIFGNIIAGGIIGIAVDAYTGSMYKLDKNELFACLNAENTTVISHQQEGEDCHMVVVSKADPSWQQVDTMTPVAK